MLERRGRDVNRSGSGMDVRLTPSDCNLMKELIIEQNFGHDVSTTLALVLLLRRGDLVDMSEQQQQQVKHEQKYHGKTQNPKGENLLGGNWRCVSWQRRESARDR